MDEALRGVNVIDAQIERPVDDFDRLVVTVVYRQGEQSAQAANAYLALVLQSKEKNQAVKI